MTRFSKSISGFIAIIVLFFAINYPWTRAAFAWSINTDPCPTALIEKAKKRLIPLFGSVLATPLINCKRQTESAPGFVNFAPFLPDILTLRQHGQNKDVIAHEYVHTELSTRLGFFPRFLHIPTWFDEGLAMQVDHRSDYSEKSLKQYLNQKAVTNNRLQDISNASGFFRKGHQGKYHYALSRCVVQRWLKSHRSQEPKNLIQNISWFGAFPYSTFLQYEKDCMTKI